ncbi:MAG: hypothetical protein HYY65_10240 [Candidatus Tectomicrobia bacterium]|uniref:Uncharacterized protein n=1 Tax=Tectimicrobiota bacterium TaxID=2528274 RepID=A0A932GQC7_UNCTE|nr:hypothetical protein [Candidatus Tectomicrobia bacterium]
MALLQRILSFSRRLSDGRKQLLVGLNAWMLREWEGGKLTADVFSSWHKAIGGLGGPVVLWETLLQCVQHETEERFGWDWWLLDQHEGEVVKIDLDISLMQLFCLRAAEELKGRPAEAWTHLKLPVTRDTRYVADRVAEVVRGMIEAEAKWRAVLSDGGIEGLRRVLDMASEARALGREEEIDQLIAAPLDQDRVRQFKEEFLESWQEHAGLRAVVKEHGNFEVGRFAPKGHDWFGLNRLELKEVFAQAEFMSMGDLGREFGRWFGESENQLVLKQFVDALPRKERLGVKPEEVLGSIDAALGSCQRDGLSPAVLILGEWRAALMIEESQDFIAAGGAVTGPLCGKYRQVPVFKLSSRLRHIVLVVDLKAIGRWRQYEVRSESSAEEIVGEHVLFAVEPVSEEHARKLIAEQPEFKKDQDTGKELEDTEAVRRLRQRVHLRILQQFDFVVEKREAGFKILLGRE